MEEIGMGEAGIRKRPVLGLGSRAEQGRAEESRAEQSRREEESREQRAGSREPLANWQEVGGGGVTQ